MAVRGRGEPAGRFPKPPEDRAEVPDWFEAGLTDLVDALQAEPDERPRLELRRRRTGDGGVLAATHGAGDRGAPLGRRGCDRHAGGHRPAELAADGIDELMAFFAARRLAQIEGGIDLGGTVHLHCTDVPGEWTFTARGTTFEATGGHAKADVALRGPAAELLLVLWGRRSRSTTPKRRAAGSRSSASAPS